MPLIQPCAPARHRCRGFLTWFFLLGVVPTCFAFEPKVYAPNSELVGSFLGPNGWRGHIAQNPQDIKIILWEAPDGLVVIGKLLDRNGRDLNEVAQLKHKTNVVAISVLADAAIDSPPSAEAQVPDSESNHRAAQAYEQLRELSPQHYTTIAPSHLRAADVQAQLYAFYDFECPFCASALRHITSSGIRVNVHWLPVAILGQASASWGAAVLDGTIDIHKMAAQPKQNLPNPKRASLEAVAHNTALLKAIQGRASTPLFLYQTPSGKVLSLAGFSEAAPGALNEMLNAP